MSAPYACLRLARGLDPAAAFARIAEASADVFWLDAGVDADTGWSFVGSGHLLGDDSAAMRSLELGVIERERHEWAAGPFRGGWVGWVGYDSAAALLGVPATATDEPASAWLRATRWLAFDHDSGSVWAVAEPHDVGAWAAQWDAPSREDAHDVARAAVLRGAALAEDAAEHTARARHEPDEYAALIERCRDAIRAGDAYQLCLTTRFDVDADIEPIAAYARLRALSRTGRGAFVRAGEVSVLSASPEQFLRVDGDVVRTRPIKGTRPRASDAKADAALAAELLASEKERAENVMIVDLMRNDLARVCQTGTVQVEQLLVVESYPQVHQLVSTVTGRLRAGTTLEELLLRTFPAGSMTGAPKLSAMTILHDLEQGPRGVYSGCLGWIGDDGSLDLAMVIRTIVVRPRHAYVGAGGGITWSSVAADEVREVALKARAPLAALRAALPPGW